MTIHHVFANRSNIGDWLSAKGIQSLLSLKVTEHLCDEPFVPKTLAQLSKATAEDFIIIGGGGLFMDYFLPFWKGFRAIANRVPFCLWGVGYCDLKQIPSKPPLELLEEIVSKARLSVVRDKLTWEFLKRCELPPPVACPSTSAPLPIEKGFGLLHADNYDTVGGDVYEAMDQICQDFAKETGRVLRKTNNRIEGGRENQLEHVLLHYSKSDVVVTSALHACILGLAMGRKVIAVSGDYKVDSFMEAAGLSRWVCNFDEVKRLPEMLKRIHEQERPSVFIERTRQKNLEIAQQIKKMILMPAADQ